MDKRSEDTGTITLDTPAGRLAGARAGGLFSFKGVPYAKPPVGPLRWRAPEPLEPWAGTRNATSFGAASPQAPTQITALTGGRFGVQSEDCLYLNIWTPGCDSAKRPVMVWIHGGAFAVGAGSQTIYDGSALAAQDAVIVTINYRLGAFGFLDLADATDGRLEGTGAEGVADQIAALRWVKHNIACFGGDPGNVTIFGESAGGMSVAALLASPSAKGLFHKAIAQSGAGHIGHERDRGARAARAVMEILGIAPHDVERLRAAPFGEILKAQITLLAEMRSGAGPRKLGSLPFQPTVDGTIIPERPIDAIRKGSASGIALMAGTTKEEWKMFSAFVPQLRFLSVENFASRATRLAEEEAPELLAAYAEGSGYERFNAMMTDKAFAVPAARLLEAQSAYAPAYAYRFDWRSKLLGGIMGSCHAIELGFVFGTYNGGMQRSFFGKGPEADALSVAAIQSWIAFARSGNPATNSSGAWPQYGSARNTMIFGDGAPHLAQAPNDARRTAWDRISERRIGP